MKILKNFVLLSLAIATTPVFAMVCRDYPTHYEVKIAGKIGSDDMMKYNKDRACPEGFRAHLDKPLIIYFSSFGGYIDKINEFLAGMKEIFVAAREKSGATPTFIIYSECSSACIPIMSGLNQMAKQGLVHLMVDAMTDIGFHGCSDEVAGTNDTVFTEVGTRRYLGYFMKWGATEEWIAKFHKMFETPEVSWFRPLDPEITSLGALSNAAVVVGVNPP